MNDTSKSRSSDCVSIVWDQVTCQKTAKAGHVVYLPVQHNILLHSNLPKKETTKNATTAVATNITQRGLPVVRIKLTNRDLSLNVLAMCESGSSISFVDKSVVSKFQFQGRKASLSVAGFHGSQDVKTEIVPIAVSAHEKSRPLTTVQFYVHKILKLGDQIVELQELKDRYPHLMSLPDQSYNLNDVQVILKTFITSSPFWIQEVRRQNCTMGSQIKDRLGLKWSATSEAGSSSCHDSNINCRWQTSKPVEYVVVYRVLRFELRCHQSFERGTTSNQDVGGNNAIQRWKIWSRTSVARGRSEVTEQILLCNGATQVPRTAPAERRNAKEALPWNHWHRCQCWIHSQSRSSWTEWNKRQTADVFTTSSCYKPA